MPSLTVRPAAGNAGAKRIARVPSARCAASNSAPSGPRAAESTFLKKSEFGSPAREVTARETARAARCDERERELVLKACTDSGVENCTLVPNQTRTVRPVRRNAAPASQAPVRSSARRTMRPECGSANDGRTKSGLRASVGIGEASLFFKSIGRASLLGSAEFSPNVTLESDWTNRGRFREGGEDGSPELLPFRCRCHPRRKPHQRTHCAGSCGAGERATHYTERDRIDRPRADFARSQRVPARAADHHHGVVFAAQQRRQARLLFRGGLLLARSQKPQRPVHRARRLLRSAELQRPSPGADPA